MKKLTKYRTITVFCRCGERLVRYKKGPGRTLQKIRRDRVVKDYTGIFMDSESPEGTDIVCVSCEGRIATIKKVNGKFVNKVNQGQLGNIRKS